MLYCPVVADSCFEDLGIRQDVHSADNNMKSNTSNNEEMCRVSIVGLERRYFDSKIWDCPREVKSWTSLSARGLVGKWSPHLLNENCETVVA